MSNHTILHLSLIEGVGPSTITYLIEHRPQHYTWPDLYQFSVSDWKIIFGCTEKMSITLVNGLNDKSLLDKELALIEKHRVYWMTLLDADYPVLLRHIHYPPSVIWWQGSSCWKDSEQLIAIVGSRKANFYAQEVIESFVPKLVNHGWVIVSGGALGADGMAHAATLKAGGKTVVVLGSGLAHKYPQFHAKMFETILASGGSIISTFPVDTPAYPSNFPIRNRVVSGLSKGCFVVQAALKSGARITAHHALEQGRDVFALPGSIKDLLSAGCHALIQQGAKLVMSVEDIVNEYPLISVVSKKQENQGLEQLTLETILVEDTATPEGMILNVCSKPVSIDELLVITQIPLLQLQAILFELQLAGQLRQDFSGMWHQ